MFIFFTGKSRKACGSSQSAGLQSPDYPTLPMTISTEALQQSNKNQRAKFPKSFFIKPSLRGFQLLGLKKAQRHSPLPASRSCEDLDGPLQPPAGPWKRSHSLGDLQWDHKADQRELKQLGQGPPKPSSPTKHCKKEEVEGLQTRSPTRPPPISPKTRLSRPPVPSQLPLPPPCRLAQPPKTTQLLSSPNPNPLESNGSGERVMRTHTKKPPVPPPVPAKKSRERLANGLRSPTLSLPSSPSPSPSPTHSLTRSRPASPAPPAPALPAKTPSTPASPSATESVTPPGSQPPWLSDLSGKVAVSRKPSHNKSSPDLLTLLELRLEAEGIDLTEEPYSDKVSRQSLVLHFGN